MIYELQNFISPQECVDFITLISNSKDCSPFTNNSNFTNNKWKDNILADKLFDKLLSYKIKDNMTRPNDIIMSGIYIENDIFSLHTDTGSFYDPKNNEESRWTLLIYLNDDFIGGETVFYDDNWSVIKIIKPKKCNAVLFDINLWHKGNKIITGKKMWIGCEIIGNIKN